MYHLLDLTNLILGHGRKMCKVKTQTFTVHIRTLLLNMLSQHTTQRLLQDMSRCMIAGDKRTVILVNLEFCFVTHTDSSVDHLTDMTYLGSLQMYGLIHPENTCFGLDNTCISDLTAHRPVERCLIDDDSTL